MPAHVNKQIIRIKTYTIKLWIMDWRKQTAVSDRQYSIKSKVLTAGIDKKVSYIMHNAQKV